MTNNALGTSRKLPFHRQIMGFHHQTKRVKGVFAEYGKKEQGQPFIVRSVMVGLFLLPIEVVPIFRHSHNCVDIL